MGRDGKKGNKNPNWIQLKFLLLLQLGHWVVTLTPPCWYPWCSQSTDNALSHYTSCAVLWVPMERTVHLPLHRLSEAPREDHRLAGAQPNPVANTELLPVHSPAVCLRLLSKANVACPKPKVEGHFFLEGNESPGNAKKQASKQTKRLGQLVWVD